MASNPKTKKRTTPKTKCPICGAVVAGRRKYCSPDCAKAARKTNVRANVDAHRRRKRGQLEVVPDQAGTDSANVVPINADEPPELSNAHRLQLAIDAADEIGASRALASIIASRLTSPMAAAASESGIAALSRELREAMRVVAAGKKGDETDLAKILSAEHRFGGA